MSGYKCRSLNVGAQISKRKCQIFYNTTDWLCRCLFSKRGPILHSRVLRVLAASACASLATLDSRAITKCSAGSVRIILLDLIIRKNRETELNDRHKFFCVFRFNFLIFFPIFFNFFSNFRIFSISIQFFVFSNKLIFFQKRTFIEKTKIFRRRRRSK